MKKLITLMLGMTIVLGSTALFAETAEKDKDKDKKVSKTHKTKTKKTKAANLLGRLDTYADGALRFATDFSVSSDNNEA